MTHRVTPLVAAALLFAAGCSIPYATEDLVASNTCDTDGNCPAGSACTQIDASTLCVSASVDLANLVLEVRPALGSKGVIAPALFSAGSHFGNGVPQLIGLNIQLPANVAVAPGRVFLPCAGDAPVPAKVTFRPVPSFDFQPAVGLANLLQDVTYQASSVLDAGGSDAFALSVPPGLYDLYLQPQPDLAVTPDCLSAPPIFLPRQTISKTTGFAVHAAAPLALIGTLKLSEKEDFTKWFLEVVEPYSGKTISEVVQPEQNGIALEVPFEVHFDWTARETYTPIIRLRPPENSGKPVVHWRLDAVALQGLDGDKVPVKLDVSSIDTAPRAVGGQVFHDGKTAAATITLRSTSISGDQFTRYETVVETDDAGHFDSALPPGDYQVIARPHSGLLAVGSTSWKIAKGVDCFCGNSVTVPAATTLAGEVATPLGDPALADIRLSPSATGALAYLAGIMLPDDVQPRQASAVTVAGTFQVSVDPGVFDLSIVSSPGSGYPWLVRPRLLVPASDASSAPVVSLEPFELQSPVVVRGVATDANGVVLAGATLRAWLPLSDTTNLGDNPGAAQIGETVTRSDGSYLLLLPPSLKNAK